MSMHFAFSGAHRLILAVTGASGTAYALSLLQTLMHDPQIEPHVIFSPTAATVMELETGQHIHDLSLDRITLYDCHDLTAAPASGSWIHQGMIVCPCSMTTLANIRHGTGGNLIHRSADVTLKEGRPLIVVPRETPLSSVHLENMLGLARAGACIVPACPSFYHRPETIQDLINQLIGRILDQLGIHHDLAPRWGEEAQP